MSPDLLRQMLSGIGSGGGASGTVPSSQPQQSPQQLLGVQLEQAEVLYRSQLEQLQTMGFPNRQANLNGEPH